jgi:hypothetical protein
MILRIKYALMAYTRT